MQSPDTLYTWGHARVSSIDCMHKLHYNAISIGIHGFHFSLSYSLRVIPSFGNQSSPKKINQDWSRSLTALMFPDNALQWCHVNIMSFKKHWLLGYFFNSLFWLTTKKMLILSTSLTLCERGFPPQKGSNVEITSISLHHHEWFSSHLLYWLQCKEGKLSAVIS